jgi:hypothetical protein
LAWFFFPLNGGSGAGLVQPLQQLVCGQLDLLMTPVGSTVLAGDQAGSMNPAKVPIYERVSALGLIGRFLVKAEVPIGVLVPSVGSKVRGTRPCNQYEKGSGLMKTIVFDSSLKCACAGGV